MLRGVIFDMDGVLVDSHPAHRRAWRTLLLSTGHAVSERDLMFVENGQKREVILRHFFGELSSERFAKLGAQKDRLFQSDSQDIKVIEGTLGFLDELEAAEIPKVVATSAGRQRAQKTLEKLGLARRFVEIVTGSDVCEGKPDPAIFHLAAGYLCAADEDLLVVEDSTAGVRGAKQAGMKCLGIGKGDRAIHLADCGADLVVPDFLRVSLSQVGYLFQAPSTP